ncbi:MAG TPA: efflux RND transporter periplasmic adaptor subunit [Gallionella sp.]|nr:efflux RND transporter periplasmic adaptor subunit [Gallionella sp.]
MEVLSRKLSKPAKRRIWIAIAIISIIALAAGSWFWHVKSSTAKSNAAGAVQVISAPVIQTDVSVKLTANGTVSALQSVDVRPQNTATIKSVHIKEGEFVHKGDRLFTLDTRTEDANLSKAEAQVVKDRADMVNAEKNLERQRELLRQEYISQSDFDAAQTQYDVSRGQLAVDQAALEASRVARSFDEIDAPISGRTGAISVYPGSLVQPGTLTASGAVLVTITQLDPINVSFTLPEHELAVIQQAFAKSKVSVTAKLDLANQPGLKGHLVFLDNAVDTASGTIRLKAEFPNADHRLWPGMFVTVELAPSKLDKALTVPAQAVQTGPEQKFLYVIGPDNKVASLPVKVSLIQDGIAVVEGIAPGTRVVVEGAQNLRPGSTVVESKGHPPDITTGKPSGSAPKTSVMTEQSGVTSNSTIRQ